MCLICPWTHRWPAGPCFYENHWGSPTLTLLNVLGVLGVLNVLNVLHVLHVLRVLNMLMDASLACWALLILRIS